MNDTSADLEALVAHLDPAMAERRLADARAEAVQMERVVALVVGGMSRRKALMEVFPEMAVGNRFVRLKRFETEGLRGMLNTYQVAPRERSITLEVAQRLRGMLDISPDSTSRALVDALGRANIVVGVSTVDAFRRREGLVQPRGPRPGKVHATRDKAEPLPAAGAMLLIAAECELGAVAALTDALVEHLGDLPEPICDVIDDSAHRDGSGRFLGSYNAPKKRSYAELGQKFETSKHRASEKDLREMRTTKSSTAALYLKSLRMTLLPVFVETARWSSLRYWSGDHLKGIVGIAYQPSTLDKFGRELKLSGASHAMKEEVCAFWSDEERAGEDGAQNMAVVYVDTSVKPVFTHIFSKCAKVSSSGRVMPATSTMMLHSGSGTPLVYRNYSGAVSLCGEVPGLLRQVEEATGAGSVRRVVVMDREGQSVALFKNLIAQNWSFIVPLRSNVLKPLVDRDGSFTWLPYGSTDDEVCESFISLADSRTGQEPLQIRAVGRRRASGKRIFWVVTPIPVEERSASSIMKSYFDRWPLQEHVFRDGKGRVGLDAHHGYGKEKVTNYAVIDQIDRLQARVARLTSQSEQKADTAATREAQMLNADERHVALEEELETVQAALHEAEFRDVEPTELTALHKHHATVQATLLDLTRRHCALERGVADDKPRVAKIEDTLQATLSKLQRLQRRQEIFTVDVELDEILLAYKLTFMNLSKHVMRSYLGRPMEIDSLIRSVFTLPGERIRDRGIETIRLFDQPRDPATMAAVRQACVAVNALKLENNGHLLRFEVVSNPRSEGGPG